MISIQLVRHNPSLQEPKDPKMYLKKYYLHLFESESSIKVLAHTMTEATMKICIWYGALGLVL